MAFVNRAVICLTLYSVCFVITIAVPPFFCRIRCSIQIYSHCSNDEQDAIAIAATAANDHKRSQQCACDHGLPTNLERVSRL